MADRNDRSEIDLTELTAHHQRLGAVLDRATTAAGAAREPVNPFAFGLLGFKLGQACAESHAEAVETLDVGVEATRRHIRGVGRWKDDVDLRETEVASMFRERIDLD